MQEGEPQIHADKRRSEKRYSQVIQFSDLRNLRSPPFLHLPPALLLKQNLWKSVDPLRRSLNLEDSSGVIRPEEITAHVLLNLWFSRPREPTLL